jgi:hypothetical protein
MIKLSQLLKVNVNKLAACVLLLPVFSACSVKPFRLILLPDTQTYSRLHPEIFYSQTEWIARYADSVAFVLHQGDITDDNVDQQWQVAQKALTMLDGKVPYTVVPGNHDMGEKIADTRNTSLFNQYFPYEKYSKMNGFGGAFEAGKMENVWHTFKAGGEKWLILSLEFGPRNRVLDWANKVVEDHPRHKVIVNTHAYMYSDDTRMGEGDDWIPQVYGLARHATDEDAVNNGEQIWEKLISRHPNMFFVFSGHVLHDGTGTLVSEGVNGNNVYQMLANYQGGVDGSEKGGNGFLRILTIDPSKKRISVKTYSPYINQYKTDPDQQFVIKNVEF